MTPLDPFDLDWGHVTTELSSDEHGIAMHVLNHNLESRVAVERTIRFTKARVRWFSGQLPADFQQWVVLDDRGQGVSVDERETLRSELSPIVAKLAFFTEGLPKPGAD